MTEPLLFLSHAGEEEASARELARLLDRAGVPVWLDVERLRPGDRWMDELQDALRDATAFAVYVGRSGVARWVGQEVRVALDRSVAEEGFTVIPILGPGADPEELPVFLRQHHWVDLRDGLDDAEGLRELAEVVVGEDRRGERLRRSLLPPDRAPFLGLRPFGEEDAFLFYGRDREVEELLAALGADSFLAVVGASGCGKSSLVRAGLLPALRRGRAPGSGVSGSGSGRSSGSPLASWRIAVFRPADDPFRELAAALPDLDPELGAAERMEVGARIASSPGDVERAVAALVPAGTRTLLVADQLEEVFTQTADPDARRRFLDALLASGRPGGDRPVHVLVTLRADFYSRCWEHPDLPRRIAANQYPVERMARDQLREVVEKPLALAGVTPEPGLADELLDDAGDEPGNLPLLEHALFQLWDQPASRRFTHEAYREMGGLAGALEHHAETVFEGFDPDDRDLVRRLLLCLVVLGEAGAVTRRRTPKGDLLAVAGEGEEARERAAGVLGRLVEARLLTATGGGEEPGEERVEVAHEALLRSWDRLRGWLEEDREFLLWRQRLTDAVAAWERSERSDGELLRGGPLRRAESWVERRREDLTPAERDLIEASLALEAAERERDLAQARARAAAERRARLRLGWAVLALFAGILATGWLMLQARRQAHLSFARELAARAEVTAQARPQLAALLALHALRIGAEAGEPNLPEGETGLRAAVARLGGRVVGEPSERVLAGALTERAVLLATTDRGGQAGSLRLRWVPLPLPADWQIAEGEARVVMEERPIKAALSPSGAWLVASPEGGAPRLWWSGEGGAEAEPVALLEEGGEPLRGTAAWFELGSADAGSTLRIEGTDGQVRVWSLPVTAPSGPLPVSSVQPSQGMSTEDRQGLELRRSCRGLVLWGTGPELWTGDFPGSGLELPGHERSVVGCASRSGAEGGLPVLTWTAEEPARLWEASVRHRGPVPDPTRIADLGTELRDLLLDPAGRWLLQARPDLAVVVHEISGAEGALEIVATSEPLECDRERRAHEAALSPEGRRLAFQSWSLDFCVFELSPGAGPVAAGSPTPLPEPLSDGGAAWDLALSPEGEYLGLSLSEPAPEVHLVRRTASCPGDPPVLELNPHLSDEIRLDFGPTRWLAAGDSAGLLQMYRLPPRGRCEEPEDVFTHLDEPGAILALDLGPERLAVGRASGTIDLWNLSEIDAASPRPRTLLSHRTGVSVIALNPAGDSLISGDDGGKVLLWSLDRADSLTPVVVSDAEPIVAASFREQGPTLVTVDRSGSVWAFTLDLDRLRSLACRAAGRNLSPSEARSFLGEEEPPPVCPGLPRGVD